MIDRAVDASTNEMKEGVINLILNDIKDKLSTATRQSAVDFSELITSTTVDQAVEAACGDMGGQIVAQVSSELCRLQSTARVPIETFADIIVTNVIQAAVAEASALMSVTSVETSGGGPHGSSCSADIPGNVNLVQMPLKVLTITHIHT